MGRLRWLPVAALLLGTSPCVPEYPGETAGSFEVTGELQDNGCGSQAVPARDPVTFFVEIRQDRGEAFWRRPDAPLVSGTAEGNGVYRFESTSHVTVIEPDPETGVTGCVLEQAETIEATIVPGSTADAAASADAGTAADGGAPASLEGTHLIELAPVAGSDCTDALAAAGGPFLALPCELSYALGGQATAPF